MRKKILHKNPPWMTPLRWKILGGYGIVLVVTILCWQYIVSAWQIATILLAPLITILSMIFALKIGAVIIALWTLLIALLTISIKFILTVFGMGVTKGLLIPPVLSVLGWLHKKSEWLQDQTAKVYGGIKKKALASIQWWKQQNTIDKILLAGFFVPLIIVFAITFLLRKVFFIFVVKKGYEQVVQKATKMVIKNFHRIPVVGKVPKKIAEYAKKHTNAGDRKLVVKDLQKCSEEFTLQSKEDNQKKH